MQAQKEAPAEMQCKDKFLLQSVVAPPGATAKDVTAEMFLRGFADSYEKLPESKSLVSKLTEERAAAIQQDNKLRQELELLKRESNKSGGVSIAFVIIMGLVGILSGYQLKMA